ncbi:hypothetical protein LR48_Vigan10g262400 [Vigna angularis]|uniref:Uncharacterized protein n=1 Tax=Phaseolus angularis TaxID=3914 RepID=A0A0L9VPA6_PHAAN|nr:hypothetical protein LR48_Vigan10g262400 [Vigna angularis]
MQVSLSLTNLAPKVVVSKANTSAGPQNECKAAATCYTLSVDNVSKGFSDLGRALNPKGENSVARVLAGVDYFEPQGLNKHFLRSLVKADHPEVALLLRQLLIAFSSLLRLNLHRNDRFLPSSLVSTFIEISQLLLLEFAEMVVVPQQSALLLFDGACSYLRELVGYFPFTDPTSSRKVHTELIQVHMRAIGKSILLQGKGRTLTFHERQSSAKPLHCGSVEAYSSTELHCFALDEFRTRLRKSFKAYIEKSSELHLLSTIQAETLPDSTHARYCSSNVSSSRASPSAHIHTDDHCKDKDGRPNETTQGKTQATTFVHPGDVVTGILISCHPSASSSGSLPSAPIHTDDHREDKTDIQGRGTTQGKTKVTGKTHQLPPEVSPIQSTPEDSDLLPFPHMTYHPPSEDEYSRNIRMDSQH